jgi:hypothetical protein
MREAQHEFDAKAMPVCPVHLTSPALHRVLAYQPIQQHVWGGKGVGSQARAAAFGILHCCVYLALAWLHCRPAHLSLVWSGTMLREMAQRNSSAARQMTRQRCAACWSGIWTCTARHSRCSQPPATCTAHQLLRCSAGGISTKSLAGLHVVAGHIAACNWV